MIDSMELKVTSGVKLIGIHGKAGAGKDTIAEYLIETYKNYYLQPLAEPLKEAAAIAFGIPEDFFHNRDLKEVKNERWGKSPREIAQYLGTEMFRQHFGPDFWIQRALVRINNLYVPEEEGEYQEGDTVVIPDIRFQNEYEFIKANGGVMIHVTRPGVSSVGILNHASEQGINFSGGEIYEVINDSTISELHRKIANIIISATQF